MEQNLAGKQTDNTALLLAAFNAANSRIIVFEPVRDAGNTIVDFTFSLISKATVDFFGGRDFTGQTITDALPDGDSQIAGMAKVMETGNTHKWTRFYDYGEHKNTWFDVTDTRSGDYLVRVWDNITERREQEEISKEKLEERTEEKYATLFNSIDQGFCIIEMVFDADDNPVDYIFSNYNHAFEQLTGLPDARGKTARAMVPNLESHWFELYGEIAKTGKPKQFEQGSEEMLDGVWYEVSAFPLTKERGNFVGIIFNNVTERKKIEREKEAFKQLLEEQVKERTARLDESKQLLEDKNEELAKMNKELESFTYIASHDLQEPLRKIQTFLTLIKQRGSNPETVRAYMDKISLSAERMSALIFDVLSYSKLASEEQYIPTDLNEVINTVLSDYDLAVSEKNAVIEKDILPIINAVPSQMHQLFSNLISNALKYSGADPFIEIKYATVISPEGLPQAEITVKDNGIGFDDQYSEQIFKLFQRLHGRSEYNGTGIGLSICKKIVDQHHGTISAKSNIGKGAAFTVLLPL